MLIIPEREIEIIKETRSPLGVQKLADGYLEAVARLESFRDIEKREREALALLAEKNDMIESLSKERVQRMYYQDIVYDVCTILDRMFLNTISNGKSIVCGRFGEPTNEVQEGVERLGKKVSELNQLLAEKEKEIGRLRNITGRIKKLGYIETVSKYQAAKGNIDLIRLHRDRVIDRMKEAVMNYMTLKEKDEGDLKIFEARLYVVEPQALAELEE